MVLWLIWRDRERLARVPLRLFAPALIGLAVVGLGWMWRRTPALGLAAGLLIASLVVVAHLSLLAFALG